MDKYDEKASSLVGPDHLGGPQHIHIAAALREAVADELELAANESDCRREHGGLWEQFDLWLKARAASLRAQGKGKEG